MADIIKTTKSMIVDVIVKIEEWIPMFEQGNAPAVLTDVMELLDSQQAEIERLNEILRIMYNRCICFRGSDYCSSCGQQEECESKRAFWRGYHLVNHKRVKRGSEQNEIVDNEGEQE